MSPQVTAATQAPGKCRPMVQQDTVEGMDPQLPVPNTRSRPPVRPIAGIQCTSKKRNGEPCQRWAIRGGTVCTVHGGQLPTVKKAAADRVQEARDRLIGLLPQAVEKVQDLLEAESEQVQLRAAESIMNRAGVVETRRTETQTTHRLEAQELEDAIERLLAKAARSSVVDTTAVETRVDEGLSGELPE